ncbi:MAG: hypothetical protein EA421_03290 [Gemmatimonadales bacterium]|nr:MAG: hypothetical protein EA421_03290 [Gemmatimonadales bacterium]
MSDSVSNSSSTFDLRTSVSDWARTSAEADESLLKVGYVGTFDLEGPETESHLDVVLVVEDTDVPMAERGSQWNLGPIGVPAQALVYTSDEWDEVMAGEGWLSQKMKTQTVWVFDR